MAYNMHDIWGDGDLGQSEIGFHQEQGTSAGRASYSTEKQTTKKEQSISPYEELILAELRMLRIEESRRCTAYIAVGGALFALLFMYVERLQQQVRRLGDLTLRASYDPAGPAPQTRW